MTAHFAGADQVRYVHTVPARSGRTGAWPTWVPPAVRQAYGRVGVTRLWQHQASAADELWRGLHVMLSTGTASGKTLGYLLPVVAATAGAGLLDEADAPDPRAPTELPPSEPLAHRRRPHTALYLAPTKALAHDQLRVCAELGLDSWKVATLDGDTERPDRDWARDYASYVLTNPDMLHLSVLPQHARWASFLQSLRFVVVDESHRYRGVFGAHVAAVLRRLRRVAALYGSQPRFLLASATSSNPRESAAALIGVTTSDVSVVDHDTSARGPVEMLLWEPSGSADEEAATLLAELVDDGRQTVAFVSSRRAAEQVAVQARQRLAGGARVEAYRGGYLAHDRRQLERALQEGDLRGVAATNALELGVDFGGLDCVLIAGLPGSRAAFWQQAGRAGRKGNAAQVILISGRRPMDAYVFDHPETLFSAPMEATVMHPDNPYVLAPHLAAAAQESPLTAADRTFFGDTMPRLVAGLVEQGVLRGRSSGWFWTRRERAVDSIDLRCAGGSSFQVVEMDTGRVLGHVDPGAVDRTVHPGAVYLHRGETYLVDALDPDEGEALVRAVRPGYYTQPRIVSGVSIVSERQARSMGHAGQLCLGTVDVVSQVTGFLRRDESSGTVWDETPLELDEHRLRTDAVWWTLDAIALTQTLSKAQLSAGAHAVEHAMLGLLPLFAPCDTSDVGGVSSSDHADTGAPTIFVHDGQAGGSGFAERGFQVAGDWLDATRERVSRCPCAAGCPACILSPTCGSLSQPLDKQAAVALLQALVEPVTLVAGER